MSISSARTSLSSQELTGKAKLTDVTKIVESLKEDLEKISLLPHQRDALLEQLKVYGRDPTNADPIFTKEGIETLSKHAFNSPSKTTSRNALRCLANALLLKPDTRQILVGSGYDERACALLKDRIASVDDEFLLSRIIFLTTYGTTINIENLIDQCHLADTISHNIANHDKLHSAKQKKTRQLDPMDNMALGESLKLLFNITHFCPQRNSNDSERTSRPPVAQLVNTLINIPLEDPENIKVLFPTGSPNLNVEKFLNLLDHSINKYKDEELEQLVSPLLTLIRKANEIGPSEVHQFMQIQLLPSDKDREQPVGRGESLSARLIQLSTSPMAPQVRESISALLFELSDKDASTFVHNLGYGFASGFLFQHNVPIPENAFEAWSTENDKGNGKARPSQDSGKAVNPITGQLLEAEEKIDMPEMSQEEKEREAERLFVLFDRLKKNGIITAANPMEEALHQGRFEELEDDADSD
ncbi:guanine nucleotide exchange factor synembryn [Botrytis cinerea]